jgi:hypothetical protein
MKTLFLFILLISTSLLKAQQDAFQYELNITPVIISGLPGLHSYAFGQSNGKWLIIGGRKDGLHARQPFNAFPAVNNNTDIYVVDVNTQSFWQASLNSLPTGIKEQLQSTNMNFYQDADTLYIIGGYAFSTTENDHITFPKLTTINVSGLINAVVSGNSITSFFKQMDDNIFAITGGQLGKIGDTFYLVGGHRFDGRYNPMNNPTFTQTYANKIQKFTIDNSGTQLSYGNYDAITDAVHLHRRDYNLLPQIFSDGTAGYTISSGVFQANIDLPYLYPVDITEGGYTPVTSFNQYLSNYHSAKACLYDSLNNQMHSLFFGGMSRYYYNNNALVEDNQVPFVKTISRLTRFSDGTLQEYLLPVEMPILSGASAEFILNNNLSHYESEIIKLSEVNDDTILIGHVFGGINSTALNPFSNNQTNLTNASSNIYAVELIKSATTGHREILINHPYDITLFPNPAKGKITLQYHLENVVAGYYYLVSSDGNILLQSELPNGKKGDNEFTITLPKNLPPQQLILNVVFDNKFFVSQTFLVQ